MAQPPIQSGPMPVARPPAVARPGSSSAPPPPRRNPMRPGVSDIAKADADKARADADRAKSESEARIAEAKARADEAAAKAHAAEVQAQADAARSKAEADRIAADTKARSEADARAREAMPWQIGASAAALPAGVVIGQKVAAHIDARHMATVAARNKEIASLAKGAEGLIKKVPASGRLGKALAAKLAGVVSTADKLGLGTIKGPIGLVPAALLLAEGAITRFAIAPNIKDERARAVAGSIASASVFAATNLIGERLVQNATPKALPSAKALSIIETARNLVSPATAAKAAPAATSALTSAVANGVGKVLARGLPVLAAAAGAYQVFQGYQKDGARGAVEAGIDFATFGLFSAGKAYLDSKAEKKAAQAPAPAAPGRLPAGESGAVNEKRSYTTVDGRTVDATAAQVEAWERRRK